MYCSPKTFCHKLHDLFQICLRRYIETYLKLVTLDFNWMSVSNSLNILQGIFFYVQQLKTVQTRERKGWQNYNFWRTIPLGITSERIMNKLSFWIWVGSVQWNGFGPNQLFWTNCLNEWFSESHQTKPECNTAVFCSK